MRSIHISKLKGDEILGKSIYDDVGRILLKEGAIIRSYYINKFKEMGIDYIYISDEESEGIEIKEVIREELRQTGKNAVKEAIKNYVAYDKLELKKLFGVVRDIVDEILDSDQVVINMTDMKNKNDLLYDHCLNVCIMATAVGAYIFDRKKLKDLALGAIIHDFGLIFIPDEIVYKPEALTKEEFEIIKTHPKIGYDVLGLELDMPVISKNIIYMHHEKCDGTGYPLGVGKKQIHATTRLVTICDIFDSMTSPKPYRRLLKAYESFEFLKSQVGTKLDEDLFEEFEKHVALYPVGKTVLLNNGYKGLVVIQNPNMLTRPIVRLVQDDKGNKIIPPLEIDLMKELTLFITDVIEL